MIAVPQGMMPDLLDVGCGAGLRMIRKKRLPKAGERVKVGRRLFTMPGVVSMTDPGPVAPPTKPGNGESDGPTDELTEELTRTVKAAYQ